MFLTIVQAIIIGLLCLMYLWFTGFVYYKIGYAKSIEEGIAIFIVTAVEQVMGMFRFLFKIFRPLCHFFYDTVYVGWTGHDLPEKLIHTERILLQEEVLELVKKFKDSPYAVPSLVSWEQNYLSILWIDMKAVGLAPRYQCLDRSGLCTMVENIIQNFYMETRGCRVRVFIKVASSTRLYFAIPLSTEGEEYLEKQEEVQESSEEENFELFQEEIEEEETGDFEDWL